MILYCLKRMLIGQSVMLDSKQQISKY